MDILITGSENYMMEEMNEKLRKEGHRIFVLSNNSVKKTKYKRVFDQYDFVYENENMPAIIESIRPDAVIFLGAYDGSFDWEKGQKEAVRFGEGVINLLEACSHLKKHPRFIYLSDSEVYTENWDQNYQEHEKFSPKTTKATAVRQGELICGNYYKSSLADPVVVRLDRVYGSPLQESDLPRPIHDMLYAAIRERIIPINKNASHSMIHINDAVEFIYKILTVEEPKHRVYNLSSEEEISEEKIAKLLISGLHEPVIIKADNGPKSRVVLGMDRFKNEFGGKIFHEYETELPKLAKETAAKHQVIFGEIKKAEKPMTVFQRKMKEFVKALIPYIETFILFIPAFMLNNRATGSEYFENLDFYLLYVLLLAIIHGQQQAMVAGVLATLGYLFRQQYNRSTFDVMLDYNTYVWIAQIFIVGLVVGNLKDRLQVVRDEDYNEINYLSGQVKDITEINTNNVLIKKSVEEQLINQNDSFGKIYEITSSLDQYAPEEVLFYAAEVLRQLLHTDDVAIYSVANGDYARLFASTSKKARSLGNSLKYTDLTDMYVYISSDQVFINKDMKKDYPQMANAIFSEGKMQLIVMTWGLPLERMNLSQANMMRIAGFLIQNAVLRANRYMEALEDSRYINNSKLLEENAFQSLLDAFLSARNRDLTQCCVLKLGKVEDEDKAVMDVSKTLRNSDYLGKRKDGRLYILLSNTEEDSAGYVVNRLKELGYESKLWRSAK